MKKTFIIETLYKELSNFIDYFLLKNNQVILQRKNLYTFFYE